MRSVKKKYKVGKNLCIFCKGSKLLCGKERCPLLVKLEAKLKVKRLVCKREFDGSSPPSIFVGRIGYPKVFVGPLIPPIRGDTSILDFPENWFGKSIEEIVTFRFLLVRTKKRVNVRDLENKIVQNLVELSLSKKPVDSEVKLKKVPSYKIFFSATSQPFGPSAPLDQIRIGGYKSHHLIEKTYYDTDLKASEAVFWLYEKGVEVSRIQRAFSAGMLGIGKNRKLVPTRWSITAVDSIISKKLIEKVKEFRPINEFRIFYGEYLDNRWLILMMPREWNYESIEAWYPKTIWNEEDYIAIGSDWEGFDRFNDEPSIGGCFIAGRLAVGEYLFRIRRQATVIIIREIHPGYLMPVGVWNVRESLRNILKNKPFKANSLKEALKFLEERLDIPLKVWIENSRLFRNLIFQRKLLDYIKYGRRNRETVKIGKNN